MKVLYLVSWYKRPNSPNSGYFFYQMAKSMCSKADEVIVLNIHVRFIGIIDRIGVYENHTDNLHEYIFFMPAIIPRWKWLYDKLGRIASSYMIKRIKKKHGDIDIVHIQSALTAASYSEAFIRSSKSPIIYTEHSSKVLNGNLNKYEIAAIHTMGEKAFASFAVSEALAKRLRQYIDNVGVIGNIVDLEKSPSNANIIDKSDKFTFVCLGTLRKDKGIAELIRAFGKEFSESENVRLIIGGEGEYRNEIAAECELFPKHDIKLIGNVPHNMVENLFKNSDCFVLPSKYETFGIVFIEAMACGLPVIATKCGGPEELVDSSNGILIDVDDENQLRNALRQITLCQDKYDKKAISESVLAKYSSDTICNKYYEIYREALG